MDTYELYRLIKDKNLPFWKLEKEQIDFNMSFMVLFIIKS